MTVDSVLDTNVLFRCYEKDQDPTYISYWDGAILAAAKAMKASTLYSEDLNSGQTYDGVRVVNPF